LGADVSPRQADDLIGIHALAVARGQVLGWQRGPEGFDVGGVAPRGFGVANVPRADPPGVGLSPLQGAGGHLITGSPSTDLSRVVNEVVALVVDLYLKRRLLGDAVVVPG